LGKVKFGVFLPSYAFQNSRAISSLFGSVRDVVLECERLGYDSVWLDDHLMYGKMRILESWSTLSALASVTSKIRLGTMVSAVGFRGPALLAKMAATVDVISGGRLEVGLGSGVQSEEHVAYGFSFPEMSLRTERLREALEILKLMWTEDRASFAGNHFRVSDAVCEPKPMQLPHPPITVGGSGEEFTLGVTARYADKFDFGYLGSIELYRRKLEVLERHCRVVGRDFGGFEKSCWPAGQVIINLDSDALVSSASKLRPRGVSRSDFEAMCLMGTPEDCAFQLRPYLDLGVTNFMLYFGELPDTSGLRLFAETVMKKMQ
jgi:alkanesulfonate monooxygenase SsuD/methylene tetrahydromethanopterin reductase-like flavin-dependent oxidoreductase (luciferase family)